MELSINPCISLKRAQNETTQNKTGDLDPYALGWSAVSKTGGEIVNIRHYEFGQNHRNMTSTVLKKTDDQNVAVVESIAEWDDNLTDRTQNKTTIEMVVAGNMATVFPILEAYVFGIRDLLKRYARFDASVYDGCKKNPEWEEKLARKSLPGKYSECKDDIKRNFAKFGFDFGGYLANIVEEDHYMGWYHLKEEDMPEKNGVFCHSELQQVETHEEKEMTGLLGPVHAAEPTSKIRVQLIKGGDLVFPIPSNEPILQIIEKNVKWADFGVKSFRDSGWERSDMRGDWYKAFMQRKMKMRNRNSLQWIVSLAIIVTGETEYNPSVAAGVAWTVQKAIGKMKRMRPELMLTYKENKIDRSLESGMANIAQSLAQVLNASTALMGYRDSLLNDANDPDMLQHKLYNMMVDTVSSGKCNMQQHVADLYRVQDDDEKESARPRSRKQTATKVKMELDEGDDDDNKN